MSYDITGNEFTELTPQQEMRRQPMLGLTRRIFSNDPSIRSIDLRKVTTITTTIRCTFSLCMG
ncbi:MAG: hypothetical protein M3M91_04300 [Thermoproteota archaeon]|nr:hypothetical protein [Thermoproteota archaeon]